MNQFKISPEEMLESLNRSGYLLESEITKQLSDLGYFIESNQTSLDPFTGKSREIDLIAEYVDFNRENYNSKIVARTRFVFEIKNNDFPLVLLTKQEWNPNLNTWEALKIAFTKPDNVNFDLDSGFYDLLIGKENKELFTQYCSFSKKKENEQLMANHPENVNAGINKITQYCEDSIENWNQNVDEEFKEDYLRNFLYLPVLLINDDLFELDLLPNNTKTLKKVQYSRLIHTYHYKQTPKSAIVYIVTREGLAPFLHEISNVEKNVQENMLKAKRDIEK